MGVIAIYQRNREQLERLNLGDLLTIKNHSNDFNGTRAEQVNMRLQLIALAFGVMAPLWIPIDHYTLEGEALQSMVWMRILFAISMLLIGFWSTQTFDITSSRRRLALLLLPPGLFYTLSLPLLNGSIANDALLLGYTFFPFLMVVMLTIFPLTMMEGLSYTLLIALFTLSPHLLMGTLLTADAVRDLWLLGLLAAICMWPGMAQLHMLLTLYRQASRDPLTRLVNRRILMKQLAQHIQDSQHGSGQPFSILLMDLDRFKRVNDTYGHLVGDQVLIDFSALLQESVNGDGLAGRYGGEEFMVLLPNTTIDQALTIANTIHSACHTRSVALDPAQFDSPSLQYTVSIGVAQLQRGEPPLSLIERVDEGLYHAKNSGRDQVTVVE